MGLTLRSLTLSPFSSHSHAVTATEVIEQSSVYWVAVRVWGERKVKDCSHNIVREATGWQINRKEKVIQPALQLTCCDRTVFGSNSDWTGLSFFNLYAWPVLIAIAPPFSSLSLFWPWTISSLILFIFMWVQGHEQEKTEKGKRL